MIIDFLNQRNVDRCIGGGGDVDRCIGGSGGGGGDALEAQ